MKQRPQLSLQAVCVWHRLDQFWLTLALNRCKNTTKNPSEDKRCSCTRGTICFHLLKSLSWYQFCESVAREMVKKMWLPSCWYYHLRVWWKCAEVGSTQRRQQKEEKIIDDWENLDCCFSTVRAVYYKKEKQKHILTLPSVCYKLNV